LLTGKGNLGIHTMRTKVEVAWGRPLKLDRLNREKKARQGGNVDVGKKKKQNEMGPLRREGTRTGQVRTGKATGRS